MPREPRWLTLRATVRVCCSLPCEGKMVKNYVHLGLSPCDTIDRETEPSIVLGTERVRIVQEEHGMRFA